MARLTRKNIKVFAGNATNNGVFGSLQAENPVTTTNVEQIQSLPAWSVGWDSATMTSEKLPPLEEFQGIQYVTTYQQAYLMQEGIPEWAATVTYYKGSVVKEVTASGFKIYNSLTDNNTNNILSDTSNWSKVMDSSDVYAFDSSVVHIAGSETITGTKTFTSSIRTNEILNDGNDLEVTALGSGCDLNLRSDMAGVNISGNSSVYITSDQNVYTNTPTTTTATNSTEVATTGWVNSTGNNVVHLTSDETITGLKTIKRSGMMTALEIVNLSITNGVQPANDVHSRIYFKDKNANATACIYNNFQSNGTNGIILQTLKSETVSGQTRNYTQLGLYYPASGNPFTFCPDSDVNHSIVTTKAINKSANGYVKLGNGIIIQWMLTPNITRSGTVITFPTPFTTTNYAICFNPYRSEPLNENATTVTERTASNCKVYGKVYDGGDMNCPCFVLAIGF